jgi:hypothetical protein
MSRLRRTKAEKACFKILKSAVFLQGATIEVCYGVCLRRRERRQMRVVWRKSAHDRGLKQSKKNKKYGSGLFHDCTEKYQHRTRDAKLVLLLIKENTRFTVNRSMFVAFLREYMYFANSWRSLEGYIPYCCAFDSRTATRERTGTACPWLSCPGVLASVCHKGLNGTASRRALGGNRSQKYRVGLLSRRLEFRMHEGAVHIQGFIRPLAGTNVEILAISGDYVRSHHARAQHHEFPFKLLSDHRHTVARLYAGFNENSNYAKRTVFVIDKGGRLAYRDLEYSVADKSDFERLREALGALP